MDHHTFAPSRPDGVVCVAERYRQDLNDVQIELCGYPAGHPIHALPTPPVDLGDAQSLTAQQCADALRPWVRQMPGGGSQYLDQLLSMAAACEPALMLVERVIAGLPVAHERPGDIQAMLTLLDRAAMTLRGVAL